jgi:hypothetical protein
MAKKSGGSKAKGLPVASSEHWGDEPDEHDYPAAAEYLSLISGPAEVKRLVTDLAKVKKGTRLSPVLLVRGDVDRGVPLTVADGYHRICASYHLDENADIPCHLADLTPSHARPSTRTRSSRGPTAVQ